jgi:hypothetical protein
MSQLRFLPFLVLSAASCGDASNGHSAAGAPSPSTFVASVASFQGFRSWPSVPSAGPTAVTDGIDPGVPRTAYLNMPPSHGSAAFPTGTIIVKEFDQGAITDRQVFAMVKRGDGYNTDGAVGWEWFELKNLDDTNVEILWRGVAPPAGESYAPGSTTCNVCHAGARANDFVWSTALTLSSF